MVEFQVHVCGDETPAVESPLAVFLSGAEDRLGAWVPARAIKMERLVTSSNNLNGGMTWRTEVTWPADAPPPTKIDYRYFIGRVSVKEEGRVIVDKWEAFVAPRVLTLPESMPSNQKASNTNGTTHHPSQLRTAPLIVTDQFGLCKPAGKGLLDGGWLTSQMEIRLSFLNNPIRWWKSKHQLQNYSMKVSASDPSVKTESSSENSTSMDSMMDFAMIHEENEGTLGPVTYARLTDHKRSHEKGDNGDKDCQRGYQEQNQFGVNLYKDENLIFKVQSEDPYNLYFTIEFFVLDHPKSEPNAPYYAGSSHILYVNFQSEEGQITAPLFGKNSKPIGQVTFSYLVIRPLQKTILNMAKSRFQHWPQGSKPVDVGHRGMGCSYVAKSFPAPSVRENTLKSLADAGRWGADFVECDIQLTKDRVPIIYHDFNLQVNLRKRVLNNKDDQKDSNFELATLAVKDMTLKQLQSLQTYHSSVQDSGDRDWRTEQTAANADEPEDTLPFPTLQQLLTSLEPEVGINIEIKYPQFIDNGDLGLEHEQVHFFDRNDYLDTILEVVLGYANDRRILFSCFDSDACIMLKQKQNRFPVIFLTQGQSQKYPPYKDFRTLSIPAAIKFACAEQLMGINVHSEDLLRQGSLAAQAKRAGLILFCWGEDNNNKDNIDYLRSCGVDGIVLDRIDLFIDPCKTEARKHSSKHKHTNGHSTPTLPAPTSSDCKK